MVKIEHREAPSRRIRIRNSSFADSASNHMYPVNLKNETATFWICSPEWKFLNTLWIRKGVDTKSGYFCIRWRNKIKLSSLPWILYSRWQLPSQVLSLARLYDACSVANRENPAYVSDTCGRAFSIWMQILVDVESFESGKKKLWIQKISGYVWKRPQSSTLGTEWVICRERFHFRKLINLMSFYQRSLSVTRYN